MADENGTVDVDLKEMKGFFDTIRRRTYLYYLSNQLWYRQQRYLHVFHVSCLLFVQETFVTITAFVLKNVGIKMNSVL